VSEIKTFNISCQFLPRCVTSCHRRTLACSVVRFCPPVSQIKTFWQSDVSFCPAVSQMKTVGQSDVRFCGSATDRVLLGVASPASVQLCQRSRLVRFPVSFCPDVSHIVPAEHLLAVLSVSAQLCHRSRLDGNPLSVFAHLLRSRRWIEQAIIDGHVVTQVTAVRHHRQVHDVKGGFKTFMVLECEFVISNGCQCPYVSHIVTEEHLLAVLSVSAHLCHRSRLVGNLMSVSAHLCQRGSRPLSPSSQMSSFMVLECEFVISKLVANAHMCHILSQKNTCLQCCQFLPTCVTDRGLLAI
jgi:hypothetical protein